MSTTPITTTPEMETLFLVAEESDRTFGGEGQSPAGRVVQRWHDVTHEGTFRFCDKQPCHAVRSVDRA